MRWDHLVGTGVALALLGMTSSALGRPCRWGHTGYSATGSGARAGALQLNVVTSASGNSSEATLSGGGSISVNQTSGPVIVNGGWGRSAATSPAGSSSGEGGPSSSSASAGAGAATGGSPVTVANGSGGGLTGGGLNGGALNAGSITGAPVMVGSGTLGSGPVTVGAPSTSGGLVNVGTGAGSSVLPVSVGTGSTTAGLPVSVATGAVAPVSVGGVSVPGLNAPATTGGAAVSTGLNGLIDRTSTGSPLAGSAPGPIQLCASCANALDGGVGN